MGKIGVIVMSEVYEGQCSGGNLREVLQSFTGPHKHWLLDEELVINIGDRFPVVVTQNQTLIEALLNQYPKWFILNLSIYTQQNPQKPQGCALSGFPWLFNVEASANYVEEFKEERRGRINTHIEYRMKKPFALFIQPIRKLVENFLNLIPLNKVFLKLCVHVYPIPATTAIHWLKYYAESTGEAFQLSL
jgi:hypothetical protein